MSIVLSTTILGSNSALPAFGRHPTAQVLQCDQSTYLIDCGEGTQMQLRRYGVKFQRIKAIFISHLHGDHYFGLVGLLNSMNLLGRNMPLVIVGPSELQEIINIQQAVGRSGIDYDIEFVSTNHIDRKAKALIYANKQIRVEAFGLKHRIHCVGFRFEQQPKPRTYLPEMGNAYGVKIKDIPAIKRGEDFITAKGNVISNELITNAPPTPKSYAFCTDTLPLDSTVEHVANVDCLYHESTFLETEIKRAKSTFHTTAKQAAQIAASANVKQLLLGHFSARYQDLEPFNHEAKTVFENSELSLEGNTYFI